jgi:hypothetical protein
MAEGRLLAVYTEAAAAARAVAALREQGLGQVEALSPTADPHLEAAFGSPRSRVRVFTLLGGIAGGVSGLWLSIATSLAWPLMTGGKPIVSLPAFLVIGFEMTILLAALASLFGFLILARSPVLARSTPADPRFSEDRYGVYAVVPAEQQAQARQLLSKDAEEIRDV